MNQVMETLVLIILIFVVPSFLSIVLTMRIKCLEHRLDEDWYKHHYKDQRIR